MAETGCCLLLFVTVFHAEQQVLIKKAAFTTNIHLSYAEIKLQFELTAQKIYFLFFKRQKTERINMHVLLYHRHVFKMTSF